VPATKQYWGDQIKGIKWAEHEARINEKCTENLGQKKRKGRTVYQIQA
jgi:beta-N-acetylglucosaminidase